MDLKDSKEAVEKLTEKLEAQEPAMFARQRRQGGSRATLVFWGALAALAVYICAGMGIIKNGAPCRQAGCHRFPDRTISFKTILLLGLF